MQFKDINNDYNSFDYLVYLYHQNQSKAYETIDISFRNVDWIAANTCSMIGAIFQKLQNSFNTIRIGEMNDKLRDILSRNGFLAFLGFERIYDN